MHSHRPTKLGFVAAKLTKATYESSACASRCTPCARTASSPPGWVSLHRPALASLPAQPNHTLTSLPQSSHGKGPAPLNTSLVNRLIARLNRGLLTLAPLCRHPGRIHWADDLRAWANSAVTPRSLEWSLLMPYGGRRGTGFVRLGLIRRAWRCRVCCGIRTRQRAKSAEPSGGTAPRPRWPNRSLSCSPGLPPHQKPSFAFSPRP